jgi:hypothetical protein
LTGNRVQRLAESLIRLSCRRFPKDIRDERYREWTAELPAILDDPDIRFRVHRDVRALRFAAGHASPRLRQPGAGKLLTVAVILVAVGIAAIASGRQLILLLWSISMASLALVMLRKSVSKSALRIALHPTRGDPELRSWLSCLFAVVSLAALYAYQFAPEQWLQGAGLMVMAAAFAISLIPRLLARLWVRQNRDSNHR